MAAEMFSNVLKFRPWKTRLKYTQMEMDDQDPVGTGSSFHESLGRSGVSTLTEWPTPMFEEEYQNQQADQASTSFEPLTTRSRFSPTRSSVLRDSTFSKRLKRIWTLFPLQDISWIVAFSFTIGSAAFVIYGVFLLLPFIDPGTNFPTETPYATPASSVFGALMFLIGGYAGFLEGLNLNGKEVAGTNVQDIETTEITEIRMKLDDENSSQETEPQSHTELTCGERSGQVQPLIASASATNDDTRAVQASSFPLLLGNPVFIYLPTKQQLLTIYARSLLFHSEWVQFLGTIIFSFATLTSLPGVLPSSNSSHLLITLLNLLPASTGGVLFIISALLQILNAQDTWWMPNPRKADWQVGFWNLIGSLGFTLAGVLPVFRSETASFDGILAVFWGSCAFLTGSVVQLYIVMGYYA
jgi:hypothetical protein